MPGKSPLNQPDQVQAAEAKKDAEDAAKQPRRTKADIMYARLGRVGVQLRKFAAGLDEDEDAEMLDQATQAVALIRSMRSGLLYGKGPITTADGVTTSEADERAEVAALEYAGIETKGTAA